MLDESLFYQLINETQGFEAALGFRGNVDHFIGGTGNKVWYFILDGSKEDYYICTQSGGARTDVHFVRKKKALTSEPAVPGKTMELILSELAAGQKEIETSGRKPVKVEVCGRPCSHYSFSFGERAYKISDEFGITVEYSDIHDGTAGFRLRNLKTGTAVSAPKET